MSLKERVPLIENCERLFGLMPELETSLVWYHNKKRKEYWVTKQAQLEDVVLGKPICPAPLADELWDLLPGKIPGKGLLLAAYREDGATIVHYFQQTYRVADCVSNYPQIASTLPDALCLMKIHLLENKLTIKT